MNSIFTRIRDKHALWYKGIVFVFSVFICTLLLPTDSNQSFKFLKIGDVWKSENLISNIDFLVRKKNSEVQLNTISNENEPIYYSEKKINTNHLFKEVDTIGLIQKKSKGVIDSIYKYGYYLADKTPLLGYDSIYIVFNNEAKLYPTLSIVDSEKITRLISNNSNTGVEIEKIISSMPSNIEFNSQLNSEISSIEKEQQNIYNNKIKKGTVLLYKNDIINEYQFDVLRNYKLELDMTSNSYSISSLIGKLLTSSLILGLMMLFLAFFRKTIFSLNTHVTFILLMIVFVVLLSSIVSQYNQHYLFAVPLCLFPILIRGFFDSRTALFHFLNIVLLCSFFTSDKFEFVFIQLIAGIGTIFSVADMGKRSKLLVSSLLTCLFYIIAFIAYHLINQSAHQLESITNYYPFMISSLGVLFAFPLIYLFEKIFGFVSDFTLLELCDLNNPLLRQLSQKIPGTFQHSLQVANLAEEACYKIGGNALLVRTGAMYHDIGKINNARFFTENQVGEVSPHEDLTSEESAKIIINHVISGVEIAKENKLPEAIIDFIRTHHGTTTTRFFLHNYKKEHEGQLINEDLFRYPGPIPFSKETAILMMADSVEASSRSLKKYDAVGIDELVDRIIDHQISENQFINSDITFRDINQIKKIFKKRLMNIYHVRIEYPR
jgi:putative nucleotidyltransferase with HDIG domain